MYLLSRMLVSIVTGWLTKAPSIPKKHAGGFVTRHFNRPKRLPALQQGY